MPDYPTPDDDQLDWDVARDGRMRDHATGPDDEPATELYLPPIPEEVGQ